MNGNGEINDTLQKILAFYRENKPLVEALMSGSRSADAGDRKKEEQARSEPPEPQSRPQESGNLSAIEELLRAGGI